MPSAPKLAQSLVGGSAPTGAPALMGPFGNLVYDAVQLSELGLVALPFPCPRPGCDHFQSELELSWNLSGLVSRVHKYMPSSLATSH